MMLCIKHNLKTPHKQATTELGGKEQSDGKWKLGGHKRKKASGKASASR